MQPLFKTYVRLGWGGTDPQTLYTNTSEERGIVVCNPLQESQSPGLCGHHARDTSVRKHSSYGGRRIRKRADLAGPFVTQLTHMVGTLVVDLHVVGDVGSTE